MWANAWWIWAADGAWPVTAIDPAVGLSQVCGCGDYVARGAPLAVVHARNQADAERAAGSVRAAFCLGEAAPDNVVPWRWLDATAAAE